MIRDQIFGKIVAFAILAGVVGLLSHGLTAIIAAVVILYVAYLFVSNLK